jgi:uncharacterized damage-inducible protein DinB
MQLEVVVRGLGKREGGQGKMERTMTELQQVLIGAGAAAPPAHIVEGLSDELVHQKPTGVPHSLYQELWHVVFWQQVSLDWISGVETPFPASPADGFPTVLDMEREDWAALRARFLRGLGQAAKAAGDTARIETTVRCPSRPGEPMRQMTVREQLENLGAHNAYHLGRMVLLRQILGVWPPPSGGYSW